MHCSQARLNTKKVHRGVNKEEVTFVGGGKGSVLIKFLLSKPYLHILCHASNYRGDCLLYQHITSLIRAFWFSSKNGERKETIYLLRLWLLLAWHTEFRMWSIGREENNNNVENWSSYNPPVELKRLAKASSIEREPLWRDRIPIFRWKNRLILRPMFLVKWAMS